MTRTVNGLGATLRDAQISPRARSGFRVHRRDQTNGARPEQQVGPVGRGDLAIATTPPCCMPCRRDRGCHGAHLRPVVGSPRPSKSPSRRPRSARRSVLFQFRGRLLAVPRCRAIRSARGTVEPPAVSWKTKHAVALRTYRICRALENKTSGRTNRSFVGCAIPARFAVSVFLPRRSRFGGTRPDPPGRRTRRATL